MRFANNVLLRKNLVVYIKNMLEVIWDAVSVQREVVIMRKRDKGFWIAYLVFAIIMLLIYTYVPAENGFLVIVLFPLIYWFIYEFILSPKKRRSNE